MHGHHFDQIKSILANNSLDKNIIYKNIINEH
jgi:hypothetical protein